MSSLDFLLLFRATGSTPSPVPRSAVRDALDRVFAENEYQTDLPRWLPNSTDTPPDGLSTLLDLILGAWGVGHVVAFTLIGIAVVGALVLAAWLIQQARWVPREGRSTRDERPAAGVAISERPLSDAQRLAERGGYAEAIHVLLLRTIEEIREKLRYEPAPSLTSREIVARAPLSDSARDGLSALVHRVELHYFGTRPAARPEYDECVREFRALRMRLAGGTADRATGRVR